MKYGRELRSTGCFCSFHEGWGTTTCFIQDKAHREFIGRAPDITAVGIILEKKKKK